MPNAEKIICFAGDNYRFSNPHSRYHLMNALHRSGHPILWVNSIGMNMPKISRKGFLPRVWNKLRSWVNWLYSPAPDFHVLTPIALPLFGNSLVETLNMGWISFQVRLACRIAGFDRPLVFASIPSFAPVVATMPKSGLIYYYSDKYNAYRDISAKDTIQKYDQQLFNAADAVFCASDQVYLSLKDQRGHVYLLPHAVDVTHFTSHEKAPESALTEAIPHPRIGYFGSLTDSNDIEVVRYAATQRPDLNFVLIGRVLGDYSSLQTLPNVHLLGFIAYDKLPAIAQSFDVAFMAWKLTEWIRFSNPLKTKEYLCMGLPVVSIRIRELEENMPEFVYFFDDGMSFIEAIDRALAEDCLTKREARIDAASTDSWDNRTAELMQTYRKAIAR